MARYHSAHDEDASSVAQEPTLSIQIDHAATRRRATRPTVLTGLLLGSGLMAAVDQIIFHELLQWHHFYTHTTDYWQLVSDGLLHLTSVGLLLWGTARLWYTRRLFAQVARGQVLFAGLLFGMGGFQLFDGVVNHKILRLHQVRMHVENLLPYDIAWNGVAILLLIAGYVVWRHANRPRS